MVGEDLSRNRIDAPAIAGRRAFKRDDEGMPLICPTSQIVFRCIHADGRCYFAWGCFDESASAEVVVGPKIVSIGAETARAWALQVPAALLPALPEVFACGE